MSSIDPIELFAIPLTAFVEQPSPGSYTLTVGYGTSPDPVDNSTITDTFRVVPAQVSVTVTSSTVPPRFSLEASGDGTWTTIDKGCLSGVFITVGDKSTFNFSFKLFDESKNLVASHDPRLIIKKLGTGATLS